MIPYSGILCRFRTPCDPVVARAGNDQTLSEKTTKSLMHADNLPLCNRVLPKTAVPKALRMSFLNPKSLVRLSSKPKKLVSTKSTGR
jgi:hypothetical protein